MVVEETTGSLFPSDLFIQPDDQPPVVEEDLGKICAGGTGQLGYLAAPNRYCASSIVSSGLHQLGYTRCMGAACMMRRCRYTSRHSEATLSPSMVDYLADSFPSGPDADI